MVRSFFLLSLGKGLSYQLVSTGNGLGGRPVVCGGGGGVAVCMVSVMSE